MFWKLTFAPLTPTESNTPQNDGRFVLHRHHDDTGPHLDLRIETGDCLRGWRIDSEDLISAAWATEKAAHPVDWLDRDAGMARVDAGTFEWEECSPDWRTLVLHGRDGDIRVCAQLEIGFPPAVARAISEAVTSAGASVNEAAHLILDGVTARRRTVERLCGLGRELDGEAFDEPAWRRSLDTLSLDEIHAHLRAYEVRFDQKYPPTPVSRPQPLPEEESDDRAGKAFTIVRA